VTRQVLLPWERLLWSGRPWHLGRLLRGERYLLTDFRLLHFTRTDTRELALDDIGEVRRTQSTADRLIGTSTVAVQALEEHGTLTLTSVRRGAQLAALLELLAGDPRAPREPEAVRAALAWEPRPPSIDLRGALAGFVGVLIAIVGVAVSLHGTTVGVTYAADDALAPNGEKRTQADIIRFMEAEVMPWAQVTFARLKGGADRVRCETCHGAQPSSRQWRMPAVAALPQPEIRDRAWEIYKTNIDAQMRNAIYGYLAGSDNQAKAAYMREFVVPGMSRILHRPSYDFTQSYEYNRSRHALGCYHCHQVQ
jgi:cytochrome c553